jgi:hypothetical protein
MCDQHAVEPRPMEVLERDLVASGGILAGIAAVVIALIGLLK